MGKLIFKLRFCCFVFCSPLLFSCSIFSFFLSVDWFFFFHQPCSSTLTKRYYLLVICSFTLWTDWTIWQQFYFFYFRSVIAIFNSFLYFPIDFLCIFLTLVRSHSFHMVFSFFCWSKLEPIFFVLLQNEMRSCLFFIFFFFFFTFGIAKLFWPLLSIKYTLLMVLLYYASRDVIIMPENNLWPSPFDLPFSLVGAFGIGSKRERATFIIVLEWCEWRNKNENIHYTEQMPFHEFPSCSFVFISRTHWLFAVRMDGASLVSLLTPNIKHFLFFLFLLRHFLHLW